MDKHTIAEYGFILISAITISVLLMFASPIGELTMGSVINMVKKQYIYSEEKTSNEAFEQNFNEMSELFDTTNILQPGLYKSSSVEPLMLQSQLLEQKYISIDQNGFLYSGINISNINGDYILPDNVREITANAFINCTGLTLVRLDEFCENIQGSAFQGCSNLKTIIAGKDLKNIGDMVAYNCPELEIVYLNQGLQKIGNMAFKNCPKLKSIHYTGTMTEWNNIEKNGNWKDNTLTSIICSDGIIES